MNATLVDPGPDAAAVRCVELHAETARAAQWSLAKLVAEQHAGLVAARVYLSLRRRERLGGTAVGHGVAIPHARIAGLSKAEIVVAVFDRAVPYDHETPDGEPLRMMALVVSDPARPREHLHALSLVSRTLAKLNAS